MNSAEGADFHVTKAEQPLGVSQKSPYLADLQAARRYTRADHAPGRDGETPHALQVEGEASAKGIVESRKISAWCGYSFATFYC
jgi:hypothetical protein